MPPAGTLSEVLFPARDARFDAVVRALSCPETGKPADNLISNEDSYPRVAGEVERLTPPDGVYLGVGPDQNFTLIAHARPRIAFVLDFRRRNQLLHLVHKALFCLAQDRVSYLSRLTARRPGPLPADPSAQHLVDAFGRAPFDRALLATTIAEVTAVLRPLGLLDDADWPALATIQSKLAGPGLSARFLALPMYPTFARQILAPDREGRPAHLLARESNYQAVRSLQRGDRVIPLVGDFGRGPSLERLGEWLRRHRLSLSFLYVSDVEFFLLRSGRFMAYAESLSRLPWSGGARIVRTSTREIDHPARMPGDSATTIVRPVVPFLDAARRSRIKTVDDLFSP